jgi:hypothetical protein
MGGTVIEHLRPLQNRRGGFPAESRTPQFAGEMRRSATAATMKGSFSEISICVVSMKPKDSKKARKTGPFFGKLRQLA